MNKEELKSKIIYQIRKGKNTFKELVKNLYGIYPTELENLIHELLQESIIKEENNQFILISPRDQNLDLKEIKSGIIQKINTEFMGRRIAIIYLIIKSYTFLSDFFFFFISISKHK